MSETHDYFLDREKCIAQHEAERESWRYATWWDPSDDERKKGENDDSDTEVAGKNDGEIGDQGVESRVK